MNRLLTFYHCILQAELLQYKGNHGDCLVPHDHPFLGPWVKTQRSKQIELSKDRIDKLDSIDFVWNVREHNWNENIVII
jgi:hypothetical protein